MPSIFTKDWLMVKMTPSWRGKRVHRWHTVSSYQVLRDLPLLNFSQNGSTNQNIRTTRTKSSKKCSGHIHLHAFLGKLQIFQIFTYNIFSDNFESKWTSEIFILMKTYTSEARKMGGWQQQIHRRGRSRTLPLSQSSLHVGTAVMACLVTLFKNILSKLRL